MRFRRIEKDMGGMANVGLKDQHIQGKEDDVTTSESKTYIGSNAKKKVAMNKIKNTKIGDDIHYYINGQEGRGIVVKMANEYLEVFKEDGQLGTIHINDTFFVKDILINKQWDDMDDTERYEALTKIHAPSPRYIAKAWSDIPEEIKVLLQKEGGNMAGGAGSTYEQGESKDSETKDHARTGFAQNTQYSEKAKKPVEGYDNAGNRIETQAEKDSKILGRKTRRFKNPNQLYSAKEVKEANRKRRLEEHARKYPASSQAKQLELERKKEKEEAEKKVQDDAAKQIDQKMGKVPTPGHAKDSCPSCGGTGKTKPEKKPSKDKPSGGFVIDEDDYKDKAFYKQWLAKKNPRPSPRTAHGSFGTTQSEAGQEAQSNLRSGISGAVEAAGIDFGTASTKARPDPRPWKKEPEQKHEVDPDRAKKRREEVADHTLKSRPSPRTDEGGFGTTHHQRAGKPLREAISSGAESLGVDFGTSSTKSDAFRKLKPVYEGDTKQAKDTQKAYEVWLERRDKSGFVTKPAALPKGTKPNPNLTEAFGEDEDYYKHLTPNQQKQYQQEDREREEDEPNAEEWLDIAERNEEGKTGKKGDKKRLAEIERDEEKRSQDRKARGSQPANPKRKSDVEHGRYGSVGGTHNVAVSTDTKVDVTTGTGYEERPHISVEEAGKLPRGTFNPHGNDELHVRGSQDSKDEPKFSQPADQEQPVRKAGLPQQHPNTYGVRYGMKGGVKKVWCPEHQMWEETRKDWHE